MDNPLRLSQIFILDLWELRIQRITCWQVMFSIIQVQIKHILTVCEQKKCPFTDYFNYLVIPVADSPDQSLMEHFEEGIKFIDSAVSKGESVLVHWYTL